MEGCGRRMYLSIEAYLAATGDRGGSSSMDGKESACASSAVHVHGNVCVDVCFAYAKRS